MLQRVTEAETLRSSLGLQLRSNVSQRDSSLSLICLSGSEFSPEPEFFPGCLHNPVPGEETGSDGGKMLLLLPLHCGDEIIRLTLLLNITHSAP